MTATTATRRDAAAGARTGPPVDTADAGATIALTLLTIAGEVHIRVRRGGLTHFGKVNGRTDLAHTAMMPVVYHPELGYVPRANKEPNSSD